MTKKFAIFVEGQTEMYFALEAVKVFAKNKALYVDAHRFGGGRKCALYKMPIEQVGDADEAELHVVIADCSSDERVTTLIREQHPSLVSAGFFAVLGLRDLRPEFQLHELNDLNVGIHNQLKDLHPQPIVTVAVQEVEAWFIAESTHFERLDNSLTAQAILAGTGLDVGANSELLDEPADALGRAYALAGLGYDKSRQDVQRTVSVLDIDNLYAIAANVAPSARLFLDRLQALI